jgi:hypothetical protein
VAAGLYFLAGVVLRIISLRESLLELLILLRVGDRLRSLSQLHHAEIFSCLQLPSDGLPLLDL